VNEKDYTKKNNFNSGTANNNKRRYYKKKIFSPAAKPAQITETAVSVTDKPSRNQKQNKESVLERLRNPPKKTADYQQQGTLKGKDRGAR